jgi:hypothetical protein
LQIFEQSRLAVETGAALHLAPNANGILKRLGIDAQQCGANLMERVRFMLLIEILHTKPNPLAC